MSDLYSPYFASHNDDMWVPSPPITPPASFDDLLESDDFDPTLEERKRPRKGEPNTNMAKNFVAFAPDVTTARAPLHNPMLSTGYGSLGTPNFDVHHMRQTPAYSPAHHRDPFDQWVHESQGSANAFIMSDFDFDDRTAGFNSDPASGTPNPHGVQQALAPHLDQVTPAPHLHQVAPASTQATQAPQSRNKKRRASKITQPEVRHITCAAVACLGVADGAGNFAHDFSNSAARFVRKEREKSEKALQKRREKNAKAENDQRQTQVVVPNGGASAAAWSGSDKKEYVKELVAMARRFGLVERTLRKYFFYSYFPDHGDQRIITKEDFFNHNAVVPSWAAAAFLVLSPRRPGGFRTVLHTRQFLIDCSMCLKNFLLLGETPNGVDKFIQDEEKKLKSHPKACRALKQLRKRLKDVWRKEPMDLPEVPLHIRLLTNDAGKAEALLRWFYTDETHTALMEQLCAQVTVVQETINNDLGRGAIRPEHWKNRIPSFGKIQKYLRKPGVK